MPLLVFLADARAEDRRPVVDEEIFHLPEQRGGAGLLVERHGGGLPLADHRRQQRRDDIDASTDRVGGVGQRDRKSVVSGKSVSVRVDLGGRRIIKKKQVRKKRTKQSKT